MKIQNIQINAEIKTQKKYDETTEKYFFQNTVKITQKRLT
jgi:hypothetical protein